MTKETVHMASKEQREEFMEKLENPDYLAVEHEITVKAVEFIPIKKFNSKCIKAEDYKNELAKYVEEHSVHLDTEMNNFKSVISERGLYVGMLGQSIGKYNPLKSMLNDFKRLSTESLLDALKSFSDSSTPPPHNRRIATLPKRASKLLACL